MRLRPLLVLLTAAALVGPGAVVAATAAAPSAPAPTAAQRAAAGDATVVAVIDSGFSPYHRDFSAARMPKAAQPPLATAPHTWLPGFPKPSSFASYSPLPLTLSDDEDVLMEDLHARDADAWATVRSSGTDGVHYRWIPGTKVVGALTFGPQDDDRPVDAALFGAPGTIYGSGGGEHGMGSASVSVGNQFGTCSECLLVFLQYTTQTSAERALAWAHSQPWIDAVTNSYGFSAGVAVRDRVYNGTDVELEKRASERGQTTFFSAGNGLENAFTVPNSTLLSSQEGPDWVVTVGAVTPDGEDLTGTGKPADVAGIGRGYPSSYGSTTVADGDDFSGTSNATPQVAGTYAKALWEARRALPGASRVQAGGVVARGGTVACGKARRACELGDGRLTAAELRTRLLQGATPTAGHFTDGPSGAVTVPAAVADTRFATEGHGAYFGKVGTGFAKELESRLLGPLFGRAAAPARPAGEVDWFRVDSACRQHVWGTWSGGAYLDEQRTPQPAPDPVAWPTRTAIQEACPFLQAPPEPIY